MCEENSVLVSWVYMVLTLCRGYPGLLTKKFIDLIKQAEDGVLDLNKAADTLNVSARPSGPPHPVLSLRFKFLAFSSDDLLAGCLWNRHDGPCALTCDLHVM